MSSGIASKIAIFKFSEGLDSKLDIGIFKALEIFVAASVGGVVRPVSQYEILISV